MVSLADKLCVIPVVQQVVGVCTIVSNTVKSVADLVSIIKNAIFQQLIFYRDPDICNLDWQSKLRDRVQKITREKLEESIKADPLINDPVTSDQDKLERIQHLGKEIERVVQEQVSKELDSGTGEIIDAELKMHLLIKQMDENISKSQKALIEHVAFIAIGIIRAIPVIGTIYSIAVWYRAIPI